MINRKFILSLVLEHCPGWIIDPTRRECVLDAIKSKNLTFLRLLMETIEPFLYNRAGYLQMAAGVENNIPIMKYLISLDCPINTLETLVSAAKGKALCNLKWLVKNGFRLDDSKIFKSATEIEDNIPVMEYLVSLNCPTSVTCCSAARKGALKNIKWLAKKGFSIRSEHTFLQAIDNDSLDVLKWLYENGCPISSKISLFAEKCSIETLEWLKQHQVSIKKSPNLFIGAAIENNSIKMKWLLRSECPLQDSSPSVFSDAAEHGSFEMLKWLYENGCPVDDSIYTMEAAAEHQSLDSLKWLYAIGCPIDSPVVYNAAIRCDSVEKLEWLLAKGCPINAVQAFMGAAEENNLKLMEWLLEYGCSVDAYEIFEAAAEQGNIEIMEWLLQKRCSINRPEILISAAWHGCLAKMKWLFQNGCPANNSKIFIAAVERDDDFNILRWLLKNGCPINDSTIFKAAAKRHGSVSGFWGHFSESSAEEFARSVLKMSVHNLVNIKEDGKVMCNYDGMAQFLGRNDWAGASDCIAYFGRREAIAAKLHMDVARLREQGIYVMNNSYDSPYLHFFVVLDDINFNVDPDYDAFLQQY